MRAKFCVLWQTQGIRCPTAKFRLDRFILSPSAGENPQFLPFFGLRHLVVSLIGSSLKKLDMVHNYKCPLSNGIKIVSVLQLLHGEIGRTISDVQKRYGQTDRQKNSTFLAAPAAGDIGAPPNLAW